MEQSKFIFIAHTNYMRIPSALKGYQHTALIGSGKNADLEPNTVAGHMRIPHVQ